MLVTTAKRKPLDIDKRRKRNLYSVQQTEYTVSDPTYSAINNKQAIVTDVHPTQSITQ